MSDDILRYSRLTALPDFGPEGLSALRGAKILVIGCGALGSLCAMYLAASGVGTVGIADFDTIELSNLQRQIFYDEGTLGKSKAAMLAGRMQALNSGILINVHEEKVTGENAPELFFDYDFIINACDNRATKVMTDNVCSRIGKPYCIGGVREYSGQCMSWQPGCTRYSDIYGKDVLESDFHAAAEIGVLGPAAGVIASIQAAEAIKYITKAGRMLFDRLFTIDLRTMETEVLEIS